MLQATLGEAMSGGMLSILMLSGTAGGFAVPYIAGQLLGGSLAAYGGAAAFMQLLLACMVAGCGTLALSVASMPKAAERPKAQ